MPKRAWRLYGFLQPFSVLDVAGVVADPRVEDVVEGMLAEELVAEDPHALGMREIYPEVSEVGDGVDVLFLGGELVHEFGVADSRLLEDGLELLAIFFNEGDDGLSIIFGDIFGLVFHARPNRKILV